jgi:hypothetical protein
MKRVVIILLLGFLHAGVYGQRNDTVVADTVVADTVMAPVHVLKTATFDGQTYPFVELKEILSSERCQEESGLITAGMPVLFIMCVVFIRMR